MNLFSWVIREYSVIRKRSRKETEGKAEAAIRRHQNRSDLVKFLADQKDRLQKWIDNTQPDGFRIGDRLLWLELVDAHSKLNPRMLPSVKLRLMDSTERNFTWTIAVCELTPETTIADLTEFEFGRLQNQVIAILLEMHQREAALIKSMYDSMIGKPKEMCGP